MVRGEQGRAHELLAPVRGWFMADLDLPDLWNAQALLEALG